MNFSTDLLHGNIFKSMVLFTVPLLVSSVFQQFYNAVDIMIVGHYLGDKSLAAIGSCTSLNDLLIGFGMGFGAGMGIVSARVFGSGNRDKLKNVAATSLLISLSISAILFVFTRLFLRTILKTLGTPEEILEESLSYISTITMFAVVLLLYNLLSALLRSIGNSFMPLVFLIISSLLNIVLDIAFITRFSLGVRGAAIATVIAQAVSATLCALYILKTTKMLVPSIKHFKLEVRLLKDSLAIPIMTLGTSSSTFESQNYGAGQYERIRKGVKCALLIAISWSLFLLAIIPFTARNIIAFLSGSSDERVLNYGATYMSFAILFYTVLGAVIVLRNSLQGMQRKILPLISSVIELLGKVLFTILVIPRLGTWGLILCEPLIWCVMTMQLAFVYLRIVHRGIGVK